MGYYYDAIVSASLSAQKKRQTDLEKSDKEKKDFVPDENFFEEVSKSASEALDGYTSLANEIKSGNPGYKKLTGYDFQLAWKALCINAEKYWTEFCPYSIDFSLLKGSSSYDVQNGIYYISWNYSICGKYNVLMKNIIIPGLHKARQKNPDNLSDRINDMSFWNDFWLWPSESANTTGKIAGNLVNSEFEKNGTPLIYGFKEGICNGKYHEGNLDYDFSRFRGMLPYWDGKLDPTLSPAWNAEISKSVIYDKTGYYDAYNFIPYLCTVEIIGPDGRAFLKGEKLVLSKRYDRRTLKNYYDYSMHGGSLYSMNVKDTDEIGSYHPYTGYLHNAECQLRGLNSSVSKILDSGQVHVELTGLKLLYGNINWIPAQNFTYNSSWINHLKEMDLDLKKVYVGSEDFNAVQAFNSIMEGRVDSVSRKKIEVLKYIKASGKIKLNVTGEKLRMSNLKAVTSVSQKEFLPDSVSSDGKKASFTISLEEISEEGEDLVFYTNSYPSAVKTEFIQNDFGALKSEGNNDILRQGTIASVRINAEGDLSSFKPHLDKFEAFVGKQKAISVEIADSNTFVAKYEVPSEKGSQEVKMVAGGSEIKCGKIEIFDCIGGMKSSKTKVDTLVNKGMTNEIKLCKTEIPAEEFASMGLEAYVGEQKCECYLSEDGFITVAFITPQEKGTYQVTLLCNGRSIKTKASVKVSGKN
ncbi:MAG: hypothetical protein J6Y30_14265 [Treponema sp.]|nr:hypothetical protein [Treponema sp.]